MKKPAEKNSSPGSLKTLLKGLKALEAVCRNRDGLKQAELAVMLGVDRSTALRILNTMTTAGYLFRDDGGRYRPTMKIPRLSHMILEEMEIRRYARGYLEEITQQTGLSSHLAILSNNQVIYVDGEEGRGVIKVNAGIGNTAPVHCSATGKTLAAYLEESALKRLIQCSECKASPTRYTANTITNFSELQKELSETRKRGYAVDNEEYEQGIKCIAAPIFDFTGEIVATIGVSGTVSKIEETGIGPLAAELKRTAAEISSKLGYVKSEERFD